MLTVLVRNSQVFFAEINVNSKMQKLLTFFSAKYINIYALFHDQSFNDTLINDIVSFEQLGHDFWLADDICGSFVRYTGLLNMA